MSLIRIAILSSCLALTAGPLVALGCVAGQGQDPNASRGMACQSRAQSASAASVSCGSREDEDSGARDDASPGFAYPSGDNHVGFIPELPHFFAPSLEPLEELELPLHNPPAQPATPEASAPEQVSPAPEETP
ncbi:MAG: hypothetical protein AAGM22_15790 [Acidobacteriota bacterium]